MIFQTLDIEDNCLGLFYNNKLSIEPNFKEYENLTHTWKCTPSLFSNSEKYEYLYLYSNGQPMNSFAKYPEDFFHILQKIKAHQKACNTAKVSLSQNCFFNLIPMHDTISLLKQRHACLLEIYKNKKNKQDYEILKKAHILTSKISNNYILYKNEPTQIKYNIFGSVTGRLTTEKGSLPILSLKKEERKKIKPTQDLFVEIDLNAAEIRTLLGLQGTPQPQGDIHEWVVASKVFPQGTTRKEAKTKVFAWLYNFSAPKNQLDKIFSRQIFRDFYSFEDQLLTTPFGRKITVEERKAQNYLLQSTTSDQVVHNSYKIQKFLENKKSKIAFLLHDSIIIDMAREEANLVREIKKIFEKTKWGNFKSSCKVGKDFGSLKEVDI